MKLFVVIVFEYFDDKLFSFGLGGMKLWKNNVYCYFFLMKLNKGWIKIWYMKLFFFRLNVFWLVVCIVLFKLNYYVFVMYEFLYWWIIIMRYNDILMFWYSNKYLEVWNIFLKYFFKWRFIIYYIFVNIICGNLVVGYVYVVLFINV